MPVDRDDSLAAIHSSSASDAVFACRILGAGFLSGAYLALSSGLMEISEFDDTRLCGKAQAFSIPHCSMESKRRKMQISRNDE